MRFRSLWPAGILCCSAFGLGAQCAVQQNAVAAIQRQVQADENTIRSLNPALQASLLEDWATATKEQQKQIISSSLAKASGVLFAKAAESATETIRAAQEPTEIAGVRLPNGIGSIGTAQRNAIISNLEASGADNTTTGKIVISAIRQAGSTVNKRQKLAALEKIPELLDAAHSSSELAESDTNVEAAGALLQIAASLAGFGGVPVAVGRALFSRSSDLFDAYVISKSVNTLGMAVEKQLNAINAANVPLKQHVAQLQQAKSALSQCQTAKTQPSKTDNTATYESQRKSLTDRMQADVDAEGRCVQTQLACCRSCPGDAPLSACWTPCNDAAAQCMAPLTKDWQDTVSKMNSLDANHYGFKPPQ